MTSTPARPARGIGVRPIRLGINIDHVATLRNARGGRHPDPLPAAKLAVEAGADNITAHLREDRRHICDDDIARLAAANFAPLNLEMAATPEMLEIALKTKPEEQVLFHSLEGNQPEIDRFFGVIAGAVPIKEYLSPSNLRRLIGLRGFAKIAFAKARSRRPDSSASMRRSRRITGCSRST